MPKCIEKCSMRALYGRIDKDPIHCTKHRQLCEYNLIAKTCHHIGCRTRPTYNKIGETVAIFCKKHADPDMVDVKHKTCQHTGCRTRPTYNKIG